MTKAFDFSDLEARLKANGLPAIQGLASVAATCVFGWLKDSVTLESASNPLFAIGQPVLGALEPLVMAEIAKIAPAAAAATATPTASS